MATETTFEVKINGLDKFVAAMKNAPNVTGPIFNQAIARVPDILAKYTIPGNVPYRTGQLIQTFRRQVNPLSARWFPTVKYAPFVNFGTRPHVILPKKGEFLSWPGAAHPVRRVNHPGSRANPFMQRILSAATREINGTFVEALTLINKNI